MHNKVIHATDTRSNEGNTRKYATILLSMHVGRSVVLLKNDMRQAPDGRLEFSRTYKFTFPRSLFGLARHNIYSEQIDHENDRNFNDYIERQKKKTDKQINILNI